jgi:uncharacterized protein with HEPN domain
MYLDDLLSAMTRIAEYIEGYSFAEFKKDYKTVDAVIRNFEILGEASKNIPPEVKAKYSKKIEIHLTDARFETILKVFRALDAKIHFNVELLNNKAS